eukprot:TRINITY_DN5403_c0_g1_i4.p1 TRINITY_DN5403_c0_g1~~TRINITY_DN5403_c0_g1_i4.p1  ORF type:complete len:1203 (+),score=362.83 TRINITY_DN5403_c0_g1_i4:115-3723(+)
MKGLHKALNPTLRMRMKKDSTSMWTMTGLTQMEIDAELVDAFDGPMDIKDEVERKLLDQFELGKHMAPVPASASSASAGDDTEGKGDFKSSSSLSASQTKSEIEKSIDDGKFLYMYLLDAYEDVVHRPGTVYLFGREGGSNASVCLVVHNIFRSIFFCPRQDISKSAMTEEVIRITRQHGISMTQMKFVKRKFAFEELNGVIPRNTDLEFLKLKYPATERDLNGFDPSQSSCFLHAFGLQQSYLELFLIKRRIRGPCWLKVSSEDVLSPDMRVSWCKKEFSVDDPKLVSVVPLSELRKHKLNESLKLSVLSISLKTILNDKKKSHEIVCASGVLLDDSEAPLENLKSFSAIRKLDDQPYPVDLVAEVRKSGMQTAELCANERGLLSFLVAKIKSIDPDVIVGHNLMGFDLDVLLNRLREFRIPKASRIGRLMTRDVSSPRKVAGRLLCDTYLFCKEHMREKDYSLTALVKKEFDTERVEIRTSMREIFRSAIGIVEFIRHGENDSYLALKLVKHVLMLPLTKELTCLAGNLWRRTLLGARAERIEFLLLHEFHQRKFLLPDQSSRDGFKSSTHGTGTSGGEGGGKKKHKPQYSGGLVLEPKKGFYDQFILLLDFNSLYPSIIQEFNICFTTVDRENAEIPDSETEGVLPVVIRFLVDQRRSVKRLMKNAREGSSDYANLDIRQKALKLTANSMYGCLGFQHSRFFAQPIAELITRTGRNILMKTVELVENKLSMEVIYGDTDSIMINTHMTDIDAVKEMGQKVMKEINSLYKKLELDIDGIFKSILLLQKKKYAALMITDTEKMTVKREMKGLDMVRRDWCGLSQSLSTSILDRILSGSDSREDLVDFIHTKLQSTAEAVRKGLVPLKDFIISKSISKRPQDYPDQIRAAPHAYVARKMIERGELISIGDRIPYVMVREKKEGSSSDSEMIPHHPDDVLKDQLQLDHEWYLSQQVLPPVLRLCEFIEGTDRAILADCLGLDGSKYVRPDQGDSTVESRQLDSTKFDVEHFSGEKFIITCPHCGSFKEVDPVLSFLRKSMALKAPGRRLFECQGAHCKKEIPQRYVAGLLIRKIRECIIEYYKGWLECEDISCGYRVQSLPLTNELRCPAASCRSMLREVYSAKRLFEQIKYFATMFDYGEAQRILGELSGVRSAGKPQLEVGGNLVPDDKLICEELHEIANAFLMRNARNFVRLDSLFGPRP